MKVLHAGYVSGAVWNAIQDKRMAPDLNWLDVISRLSHFVIDHDVGGDKALPPELAVLENILCRGLPALPSLYVEWQLQRMARVTRCQRAGKKGVSSYSCTLEPASLALLERAFCTVSPAARLDPSPGFDLPPFDSQAEQVFWDGPLTHLFGPAGMQLVVRQRALNSMGVVNPEMFIEQRTDFSIQLPGPIKQDTPRGIVFEVDGPQHEQTVDGDFARDVAMQKARWAKTYRRRLWKGESASASIDAKVAHMAAIAGHPYLARIKQNVDQPLVATDVGRRAHIAALFPFAVARIQRVLLELIRGEILSLDEPVWNLVIIDRDGLPGCGRIAAIDFRLWLRRLWALFQPGRRVPAIRVWEGAQGHCDALPTSKIDVLLDVSIDLRYGASLPTPDALNILEVRKRVCIRSDYWKQELLHPLAMGDPVSLQISSEAAARHLTFFLRNLFRKVQFRAKQVDIITRALRNESVIALLPTGAGKSITYQMPAMLQNGVTVVVDPIKSLMKDQDDSLKAIGISSSAFINSMSKSKERRENTKKMQEGYFKFVFVSPERFIIRDFRDALETMRQAGTVFFAYAVVDEAHCVSEWGHDFRTAYLRLGENARRFCPARVPRLPLLGLTGTASYEVLDDVHIELGYTKDANISVRPESMERKNLHYRVIPLKPLPKLPAGTNSMDAKKIIGQAKLDSLKDLLTSLTGELKNCDSESFLKGNNGSGLIFTPHTRWVHGAEAVCSRIKIDSPSVCDLIGVYHGQLAAVAGAVFDPIVTQNAFKKGTLKVLACTKAFGMGIDKPDIRFTLHYNIPPSLESFYQEAGRSGRDNEDAQCWILYAGVQMPKSSHSLDYALNHDFHARTFPGAALEEAKVFEVLSENRRPGQTVPQALRAYLFDETGVDYYVKPFAGKILYINHPEYEDPKGEKVDVYVLLTADDGLVQKAKNPFPDHAEITQLAVAWLSSNRPTGLNYMDWVFGDGASADSAGIEQRLQDILKDGRECDSVNICFDNGYLDEVAKKYAASPEVVGKAFSYAADSKDFISALGGRGVVVPPAEHAWLETVFSKVRLREHTFRSIYRLSVLGAVSDFEADYKGNTMTAWLTPRPQGGYRERLREYIERYAPMDVSHYLDIADKGMQGSELRCCLHALIRFVYGRIAKQRLESLRIMEQTTREGLEKPTAFTEAVTTFFDSSYIPILRPFLHNYTLELVYQICEETAGGGAKAAHLLGACNRLLPENPDNAAFHALRAYALALLGYRDQDVKDEIIAALSRFRRHHGWGRSEKHGFLLKMRVFLAAVNVRCARVFDACIIEDHTLWLKNYESDATPQEDDGE